MQREDIEVVVYCRSVTVCLVLKDTVFGLKCTYTWEFLGYGTVAMDAITMQYDKHAYPVCPWEDFNNAKCLKFAFSTQLKSNCIKNVFQNRVLQNDLCRERKQRIFILFNSQNEPWKLSAPSVGKLSKENTRVLCLSNSGLGNRLVVIYIAMRALVTTSHKIHTRAQC